MNRRDTVLALLALALFATSAFSQSYPSKPIRIIVPAGPGSAPDAYARQIGAKFPEFLGQPLIVDNKPGAEGAIAAEAAAHSPADGYTLLLGNGQTLSLSPWLFAKSSFKAAEDFTPITLLLKSYWLIVTNMNVPVSNLSDLFQLATLHPGQLRYGSAGDGSYAHLFMESIKASRGIDLFQIPYKAAAAEVPDLISGRLEIGVGSPAVYGPLIKAGKLKALAVAGPARLASLPDVPTLAEAGVQDLDINVWVGVFAPAETPVTIIRRLQTEIAKILKQPEIRKQIIESGSEVGGESSEEFVAFVRNDRAKWGKIIKGAQIQPR
jgi:tripartite-type tricarboxylate transporter receptor subunit TctC